LANVLGKVVVVVVVVVVVGVILAVAVVAIVCRCLTLCIFVSSSFRSPFPSPKSLCKTPVAIVADIDGDVVKFVVANVENGGRGRDSTLGPDQERTTADQRQN
jgi:hypothetical protein